MKNSEKPAFPTSPGIPAFDQGLTKREYIAALIFANIIPETYPAHPDVAQRAIHGADLLLKGLKDSNE